MSEPTLPTMVEIRQTHVVVSPWISTTTLTTARVGPPPVASASAPGTYSYWSSLNEQHKSQSSKSRESTYLLEFGRFSVGPIIEQ